MLICLAKESSTVQNTKLRKVKLSTLGVAILKHVKINKQNLHNSSAQGDHKLQYVI